MKNKKIFRKYLKRNKYFVGLFVVLFMFPIIVGLIYAIPITLDDDEYGVSEYDNVPYEITGGVFGLKFNWDKDIGPYHSVEPFEIDSSSGSIEMYTPNFNSHTSMSMDEE